MNNINDNNIDKKKDIDIDIDSMHNNCYTYYIHNKNYKIILYLCFRKKYTYTYELNKIHKRTDWNYYFTNLVDKGILQKYELSDQEHYLATNKQTSSAHHTFNSKYYTLTEEARKFYDTYPFYDIIKSSSNEKIEEYILDYLTRLKLVTDNMAKNLHLSQEERMEMAAKKAVEGLYNDW